MEREGLMEREGFSRASVTRLREFYGLLPRPPAGLFEFFLWEVISRDALPARRDMAWLALKRIPALTPDAAFGTKQKTMLAALALAGPYAESRLEDLRGGIGEFRRHRDLFERVEEGRAPPAEGVRALARLPRFDRAMRHKALLFVAGRAVLPADPGTVRVLRRTGSGSRRAFASSHCGDLEALKDAALYLAHHARQTCLPASPHCTVCPLAAGCPAAR